MAAEALPQAIPFGGRYSLRSLLATGGMAEIYLATQAAREGFEKDVVIKRLKPELAQDQRVTDMFLDEARIGAVLNHPNIVHVYDVDEHEDVPFIVMEYILGEELNVLCRRGIQAGKFLPLEHSVELIRQAAAGLGYFHHKRDSLGKPLDIVHCDVSPTNLLITEDGFLKVIDFGIARVRDQRYRPENAVPGKLSYMAPEQCERGRVDHRSDIFSLGIVLYEITVGHRLFKGAAQEVAERLRACDIQPPTFLRQEYPGALESIVMRCLERHPEDRYQSAYELADDLEQFLRESGLRSTPIRVARYLDSLGGELGAPRRAELASDDEPDEDLDFERGMFDGVESANTGSNTDGSEWDEVEESHSHVVAVLGIDPALGHPVLRTPTPADVPVSVSADGDEAPAEPTNEQADDQEDSGQPSVAPSQEVEEPQKAAPEAAQEDGTEKQIDAKTGEHRDESSEANNDTASTRRASRAGRHRPSSQLPRLETDDGISGAVVRMLDATSDPTASGAQEPAWLSNVWVWFAVGVLVGALFGLAGYLTF